MTISVYTITALENYLRRCSIDKCLAPGIDKIFLRIVYIVAFETACRGGSKNFYTLVKHLVGLHLYGGPGAFLPPPPLPEKF